MTHEGLWRKKMKYTYIVLNASKHWVRNVGGSELWNRCSTHGIPCVNDQDELQHTDQSSIMIL